VAARGQDRGVHVGLAAELGDPLGGQVGVALLVVGVLLQLGGDGGAVHALGHEVVTLVAQHADQLGGQHLVEDVQHAGQVGAIGLGDRSLIEVDASLLADLAQVERELVHWVLPSA
jgi:hypothetical protein